jgi:microcin C transport system ATP-binding protein
VSKPLLEVENLAVSFRGVPAVRGVSFSIERGETVALVGESGSGKTATVLSILGLLPYPAAHHPSGSIRLRGAELLDQPPGVLRSVRGKAVTMVFQEPMTSLNPLHTIEKQVAESLRLHGAVRRRDTRARVLELLGVVGLRNAHSRLSAYPHELSGGERQRVMIAMALANRPELLIADEPTTALDVTIQAQILALLRDLQAQFGMALLLITHDLGIVRRMAQRVCVMHDGRIVESGDTGRVFGAPQHAYTRHLLDAEPRGEPAASDPAQPVVLEARDVRVHFGAKGFLRARAAIRAVDGVSLVVREGQTVGIVGESGSGKTTLAQAILRLVPCSGEIWFQEQALHAMSSGKLRPLRSRLQIVFQDPFGSLSPRMSVQQIVEEGLLVAGIDRALRERRVAEALVEVGMDPAVRHRYPHEFSGGQRQRIAIARALVLKPRLLVLDEPTSALDVSVQAQIIELLRELQRRHRLAYLFISHDLRVVRALADQLIVMRAGRVVEAGSAAALFAHPAEPYTRELLSAALLSARAVTPSSVVAG